MVPGTNPRMFYCCASQMVSYLLHLLDYICNQGEFFKTQFMIADKEIKQYQKKNSHLSTQNEKYYHNIQNLKQDFERLTQQLSMKFQMNQSENDFFQNKGLIMIFRIRKTDDARETDACLGTSTTFGVITSNLCCQADEMIFFDAVNSEELYIKDGSVWTEDKICLINSTNNFEIDIPIPDVNVKKLCSIAIYENNQNDFKTREFEIDVSDCFQFACHLEMNSELYDNEVILNGTLVQCDQSSYFGIVTKSKFSYSLFLSRIISKFLR